MLLRGVALLAASLLAVSSWSGEDPYNDSYYTSADDYYNTTQQTAGTRVLQGTQSSSPTLSLFVNGLSILEQPTTQSYTLTWNSTGMQTCELSWVNTVSGNTGDDDVTPNASGSRTDNDFATYKLACKPQGDTTALEKTVSIVKKTVTSQQPPSSQPVPQPTATPTTPAETLPLQKPIPIPTMKEPGGAEGELPLMQVQKWRETQVFETLQRQIEDLVPASRRLRQESDSIRKKLEGSLSRDVDAELERVVSELNIPENTIDQFDPSRREGKLRELREKVVERTDQLSEEVNFVLRAGVEDTDRLADLGPVLRSSIVDIELLIESETGVDVDLTSTSRPVNDELVQHTDAYTKQVNQLKARDGLALYRDSDLDGVSDFDEINLYGTDPSRAHTAGSELTDGERILLGLDVNSLTPEPVPVESPITKGDIVEGLFEVKAIALVRPPPLPDIYDVTSETSTSTARLVSFAGTALPNSFVTLYIFSTPVIVTVKADSEGRWSYRLDKELESGAHQLHVAMIDNTGRILAKSPPVPFFQTAEAIEFAPLLAPITPDPSPIDIVREYFIVLSLFVFALIALVAIGILGVSRHRQEQMTL